MTEDTDVGTADTSTADAGTSVDANQADTAQATEANATPNAESSPEAHSQSHTVDSTSDATKAQPARMPTPDEVRARVEAHRAKGATQTTQPNPKDKAQSSAPQSGKTGTQSTQGSAQQTGQTAVPDVDWKKRFDDGQRTNQQLYTNAQQQAARIQQLEAAQKKATDAVNLKPWNARSPDYQQTRQRLDRVDAYVKASSVVSQLPPERQDAAQAQLRQQFGVTGDDVKLFREHQDHTQHSVRQLSEDPHGFIGSIIESTLKERFEQYEQYQQLRNQTDQWLNQNAGLMNGRQQDVVKLMDMPRRDAAIQILKQEQELATLRQQLVKQGEKAATGEVLQQSVKNRATHRASPNSRPAVRDYIAEARQKGLRGDSIIDYMREERSKESQRDEV
jgi:hypothetical protein